MSTPTPAQELNGVCFDPYVNELFWICGYAGPSSSVYYYSPIGSPVVTVAPVPINFDFEQIACDNIGNILAVGYHLSNMYYSDFSSWYIIPAAIGELIQVEFNGLTYNENDQRFYAVGYHSGFTSGSAWFTDIPPLQAGGQCYEDQSGFLMGNPALNSIAWNQNYDWGIVGGDNAVFKMMPFDGNPSYDLFWDTIITVTVGSYFDVAWDRDPINGWKEVAIVGYNGMGYGAYWRYHVDNPVLIEGYNNSIPGAFLYCVDFKPPSSPKWVFIPLAGGSIKANVFANDQSTVITVNAQFPKLFWIGFNETDASRTPRLDQQVPPDTSYYFRYEANYSEGWSNTITEIRAWYDLGLTGIGGSSYPPEIDANRNLAFTIYYDPSAGTAWVSYPGGALEVDVNPVVSDIVSWVHPDNPGVEDYHEVEILVMLGRQIRAANYGGVAPVGPPFDKNPAIALNNLESWDFNITVRDNMGNPDAFNTSYGEFGIEKTVSISVTGNPTGNAPPGSSNILLANPSIVTYSSNTDYWVNVSIPDLEKDGNPAGPWITANHIQVQNMHIHAGVLGASDIAGQTYFGFSGDELCVWGLEGPAIPLAPVGNGTQSAGPYASNFNYAGTDDYTQVEWWVDVIATTPEGVYWETITFSVETW